MGKVVCPGELLIDFISLDNGKSLKDVTSFMKKTGGAPANAALAINKFGGNSCFVGSVGNDAFGNFLIDNLARNKLSTKYVKKSSLPTTLAFVSLDEKGERSFEFFRGADDDFKIDDLDKDMLKNCNLIHFASATAFLDGNLKETYFYLLDYALKNNKIISFDPNYRDALFGNNVEEFINCSLKFIERAHILKISDEEALLISKKNNLNEAIDFFIEKGAMNVFATVGEKGTIYATINKKEIISSIKVDVVDTTGAGDAFIGSLLGMASDMQKEDLTFDVLKEFVKIANICASLTITKKGALESIPTKKEVLKYI